MLRFRSLSTVLAAVACALVWAGCSGPPQTATGTDGQTTGPSEPTDRRGGAEASVADYESFDASRFPVTAPNREVQIRHNVPRQLLSSRADEGVQQTLEGFRIQVYSAQDKQSSEEFREQVRQWWTKVRDQAPSDLFSSQPPIVIEYAQPYYRVRFGAFAEREQAAEALQFVREEFPDAFMARSTVTVMR